MEIVFWIIGIIALIVIGAFVTARWVVRKGHKGYTKGRNAIRDRRNKKV